MPYAIQLISQAGTTEELQYQVADTAVLNIEQLATMLQKNLVNSPFSFTGDSLSILFTDGSIAVVPLGNTTSIEYKGKFYVVESFSSSAEIPTASTQVTTTPTDFSISKVDFNQTLSSEQNKPEGTSYSVDNSFMILLFSQQTLPSNNVPVLINHAYDTTDHLDVTGNLLSGAFDADGDALYVNTVSNSILGATITYSVSGSFIYMTTTIPGITALPLGQTVYDYLTYTVSDSQGGTATANVTIAIIGANDVPIAVDDSYSTHEDAILNVPATGVLTNDYDVDVGAVLTVTTMSVTSAYGASVTQGLQGAFIYDPTVSSTLQALQPGDVVIDTFTYSISDEYSQTASATVSVTVAGVNDTPIAVSDSYGTLEDNILNIAATGVLSNDIEVDAADPLTVTLMDSSSAYGASISFAADGSFSYDPTVSSSLNALAQGQIAYDTFTYTISDSFGATDSTTVTITVLGVNDAPTANDKIAYTNEATPIAGNVITDAPPDTDPDGNPLTVTAYQNPSFFSASVSVAAGGAYTYDPTVSTTLGAMRPGEVLPDTFTYTISDGYGGTDSATIKVFVSSTATSFLLSSLDGTQGFKINGSVANYQTGRQVAYAGDVNQDGYADMLVGAPLADPGGSNRGQSYVLFGGSSPAGTISVGSMGTNGFIVTGASNSDQLGQGVNGAGDFNNDGYADMIFGAPQGDTGGSNRGEISVIYGSNTGLAGNNFITPPIGTIGFLLTGAANNDRAGAAVGAAGDVNGDGFADMIVSSYLADPGGADRGQVYVMFGRSTSLANSTIALNALSTLGFTINGVSNSDQAGNSVYSAGDVNGDGYDDVIIGAQLAEQSGGTSRGEAYVVFGGASLGGSTVSLAALGTQGFTLYGNDNSDLTGFSVKTAGDVNGDGYSDVIIGAPQGDPNGSNSGEVYVIFGSASGLAGASINVSNISTYGFQLNGTAAGVQAGYTVSGAGDFNADGYDDLLIGSPFNDTGGTDRGQSYLVYGSSSGLLGTTIALSSLNGSTGFALTGIANNDQSGISVSNLGDVNGDGFDDIIIGAHQADPASLSNAGQSYVVYGFASDITDYGTTGNDTLTATSGNDVLYGNDGNDVLQGDSADNRLIGGRGDDTLDGSLGNDVLVGGAGDDVLQFDATDTLRVDGGSGFDTLLIASGNPNFTILGQTIFTNFEQIDMVNSNSNTLTLSIQDVLNMTESTRQLLVSGDSGDVIESPDTWTDTMSQQVVSGVTYNVYTLNNATLLVDVAIDQTGLT